jgi:hypothetical protein
MHDRPDGSDRPASDVERDQEAFFSRWIDWYQIGVASFEMSEQEGTILI